VFARYDAQFQARSLDEALLDVTEHCRARQMTGEQVAAELRDAVRQCTQLTCSVGVAPNCMLAKVRSPVLSVRGTALHSAPGLCRLSHMRRRQEHQSTTVL
jgi:nucleotidyltransferase/DNA polymerase involved in DNA repair